MLLLVLVLLVLLVVVLLLLLVLVVVVVLLLLLLLLRVVIQLLQLVDATLPSRRAAVSRGTRSSPSAKSEIRSNRRCCMMAEVRPQPHNQVAAMAAHSAHT